MKIALKSTTQLLSLAFGLGVGVAGADETAFFTDFPIVASVSRLPQLMSEVPAAVTVLDRELIRASGMRKVSDLLRLVPGFQVTSANQDPAIVAYHGLNEGLANEEFTPRVQVLIDGRSQYSPLFKSGVNWNLFPVAIDDIERIEVIRGPNTVSYGSNAFLGVINVVTVSAFQAGGWHLAGSAGNNGIADQSLRWGGKIGSAEVRATVQQTADDGFQRAFYQNWVDPHDSQRSRLVDVRADLKLNPRDELSLNFNQVRDVSQFGRPDRPTRDPLRDFDQEATALGVAWRRTLSPDEEVALRYSLTRHEASGPYQEASNFALFGSSGSPRVNIVYDANPGGHSIEHELEFQHLLAPSAATRLAWGAGAKSIRVVSRGQFSTSDALHRSSSRVFGNLEYRPYQNWLVNLGASYENDSITGGMFDPRASVSYHLTPEQTLRLTASVAHRNPGLFEEKGLIEKQTAGTTYPVNTTYYSPGVKPERIESIELGYLGEFKKQRASLEMRAFYERIPNRIHQVVPLALPASHPDDEEIAAERFAAWINTPYPYGRADGAINIERVVISGVEYQARWQPFDSTRLIYSYAALSIDAEFLHPEWVADSGGFNTQKISQQTRDSAPRSAQSAMLIQQLPYETTASLMYFQSSDIRWRRNSSIPVHGYERVDWRLAKTFRAGKNRAEIAYTVQIANGEQEGRLSELRYADRLQWLTLRVDL